jgi:hypothetical protein
MAWIWLNLLLGALFVLAIVGIPLWLVITRPDTGPKPAEVAAWHRWRTAFGHRHQRTGARHPRLAHPYTVRRLDRPATER